MLFEFIFLIIGLAVLNKSSSMVVDSSITFAKITKIGKLAIGLLLVSFSTSLPELSVSLVSIIMGSPGIAIGNLFGSNIADICLILGIPALLFVIQIKHKLFKDMTRYLLLSSLIPFPLIIFKGSNLLFGVLCLASFAYFCYLIFKKKRGYGTKKVTISVKKLLKTLLFFVIGVIGVIISSDIIVNKASIIAEKFNILPSIIGATIIAVGTSLPELAVSFKAVQKKQYDLAVGNAVGSCVVNISIILGLVFVFANFVINMEAFTTLVTFSIFTNIAFLLFAESDNKISRWEGFFLLILYVVFLALLIT